MDNSQKEPITDVIEVTPVPVKKGRGRPKGSTGTKIKNTKKMGRPKELGTKVQELKDKLLMSPEGSRIVQKVIDKALNDEDPNQMTALKLCLDRILPVSMFEKAKDSRAAIQINITGLNDVQVSGDDVDDANIIDMEK